MIPRISKPTRVTKHTAAAIDNIITNFIINSGFRRTCLTTSQLYLLISLYEFLPLFLITSNRYLLFGVCLIWWGILYVNTNSKVKITEMKAKRHACLFVSDTDVETSCFFNEGLKFLISNFYFFSVS